MNNKRNLKINGLRTPKVIVFMHGFSNGRVGSAKLDLESGILSTAYTNGKKNLFYKYNCGRIDSLDGEVMELCTEAEILLQELHLVAGFTEEEVPNIEIAVSEPKVFPRTPAEANSARERARILDEIRKEKEEKQSALLRNQERKKEITERLLQIDDQLLLKENKCRSDIEAAAFALRERFFVYAHGVLMKPANEDCIPKLEYEWLIKRYKDKYQEIHNKIRSVIDMEEK